MYSLDFVSLGFHLIRTLDFKGITPVTLATNGENIVSMVVHGVEGGVGVPTPNLFYKKLEGKSIAATGVIVNHATYDIYIAEVSEGTRYIANNGDVYAFYTNEPVFNSQSYNESREFTPTNSFIAPITGYIAVRVLNTASNVSLNEGANVVPYEPHGYKIPITSNEDTVNVYLDTPLLSGESVDIIRAGYTIPTVNGNTTITVDSANEDPMVEIVYQPK